MLGVVTAWALKRKNPPDELKLWRPLSGAVAASLAHLEVIFQFLTPSLKVALYSTFFWNIFVATFLGVCVAIFFGAYLKRSWKDLIVVTVGASWVSLIAKAFTEDGIAPLWPLWDYHIRLGLFYVLDMFILGTLISTMILAILIARWRRDVARVGLIVLIVYGCVIFFTRMSASDLALHYTRAWRLKAENISLIPQPMSAFQWRMVVETSDDKLHDTLLHLTRVEALEVKEDSTRAARVAALYKPLHLAKWRVYPRFGRGDNAEELKVVFEGLKKRSDLFKRLSVFWVYDRDVLFGDETCSKYKDLRFEGARKDNLGEFLICGNTPEVAKVYQSNEKDYFSRLLLMY